jgi:cobalt transporter subunit CbtB
MSTQPGTLTAPKFVPTTHTAVTPAALLAILLGCFLIYGVGFAGPDAIHNAAHDTRHTFGFPCH